MLPTKRQCLLLLEALRAKYGPGYSSDEEVAELQMLLSIYLAVAAKRECLEPAPGIEPGPVPYEGTALP